MNRREMAQALREAANLIERGLIGVEKIEIRYECSGWQEVTLCLAGSPHSFNEHFADYLVPREAIAAPVA